MILRTLEREKKSVCMCSYVRISVLNYQENVKDFIEKKQKIPSLLFSVSLKTAEQVISAVHMQMPENDNCMSKKSLG